MIDELSLFKSGFCEGFFLFRFIYMQEFLEGNQYLHTAILVFQIFFFGSDETNRVVVWFSIFWHTIFLIYVNENIREKAVNTNYITRSRRSRSVLRCQTISLEGAQITPLKRIACTQAPWHYSPKKSLFSNPTQTDVSIC